MKRTTEIIGRLVVALLTLAASNCLASTPAGFVKRTIQLNAPPVALAFDTDGILYALEAAEFGDNVATLRAFLPNGTAAGSFSVVGDDPNAFYVDNMAYDPVTDRLLISDNTTNGRLIAVTKSGIQTDFATDMPFISGVAVRSTGEIFVSTADGFGAGTVLEVDRTTRDTSLVAAGLDYGAGLAFEADGDLLVVDANSNNFHGRLQRISIIETPGGMLFGPPITLLADMSARNGVAVDNEGDTFATGPGGVYRITERPFAESLFYTDGAAAPIATAIAFDPGSQSFEPFAGPGGGRLAFNADFGFVKNDLFVTLLTPAVPGDYDGNGEVEEADYVRWKAAYGSSDPAADGNVDGIVDAADYTVWRNHLGVPLGSGGVAGLTVPEPTALKLAGAIIVFLMFRVARVRTAVSNSWRYC